MRKISTLLLLGILAARSLVAATLSETEVKEIKADITQMMSLFEKGDAQALLDRTHESIYALVGGNKADYEKLLKQAAEQLMQSGIKFLDSELGTPSEIYAAGKYEVCFVPRISTMEYQEQKIKSTGFMLAARTVGQSGWKYLDGAGINKNPGVLKQLFPDLDAKATLPPVKIERQ